MTRPKALPMSYTGIETALPPENKNVVAILESGIPILGRNLHGRFAEYDSLNDRFVEWMPEDCENGFQHIVQWAEIKVER